MGSFRKRISRARLVASDWSPPFLRGMDIINEEPIEAHIDEIGAALVLGSIQDLLRSGPPARTPTRKKGRR